MTYSINWPITVRSAIPFHSGNYRDPSFHLLLNVDLGVPLGYRWRWWI